MEKTLGKRIMSHRKRLGLTQDALAEQLGITAQAVSKWEHDLSCPDITMLPRLAAIFGVSTDELLGAEPNAAVFEGEVVEQQHGHGIHLEENDGKWEFHWDSGRKGRLFFPLWVLLFGALLLIDNIWELDVGFWGLAWPSWLLMMGLFSFRWFSLTGLGFTLVGGYFLAENLGIMPFTLTGKIIWPAIVILFGLSLLVDALRKPKKPKFTVTKHGGNSKKTRVECHDHSGGFECDLSFGEYTHRVAVPKLARGEASCAFGSLTVDLSGCESVAEGCHIEADCAFGQLELLVPRRYLVQFDQSTAFASVNVSGHPDTATEGVILLEADASFGEILVRYI